MNEDDPGWHSESGHSFCLAEHKTALNGLMCQGPDPTQIPGKPDQPERTERVLSPKPSSHPALMR